MDPHDPTEAAGASLIARMTKQPETQAGWHNLPEIGLDWGPKKMTTEYNTKMQRGKFQDAGSPPEHERCLLGVDPCILGRGNSHPISTPLGTRTAGT